MTTRLLPALACLLLLAFTQNNFAADPQAELQTLVEKVKAKIQAGQKNEADYTDELKAFDALVAEHKDETTDAIAQIFLMKAMLYAQIFNDFPKATETLKTMKAEFPKTSQAAKADEIIASLQQAEASSKIQNSLAVGSKFPDFDVKDLDGKPLSVAQEKGKLLMIDFWATWCGPCVGELPNVIKTYQKHHDQGFDIIGVSLDKDKAKLSSFLQENKMTWPQYFDGKGWQNQLAQTYGINSIPASYLLDKNGIILAKGLRGEALESAVADGLAKK